MAHEIQKIPLIVGVAGQHSIPDEYLAPVYDTVLDVFLKLRRDNPYTPVRVLTTLTTGVSMLCARAALQAQCELWAVLPREQEEYEQEFAEGEQREMFLELLKSATHVIDAPRYEPEPEPQPLEPEHAPHPEQSEAREAEKPNHNQDVTKPEPNVNVNVNDNVNVNELNDKDNRKEEEEKQEEPDEPAEPEVEMGVPPAYYHKQAGIYLAKHCNMLLVCWDGRKKPDEERANDFTLETMVLMQEQPFARTAGTGPKQNTGIVLNITIPVNRGPRLPRHLPMREILYEGVRQIRLRRNHIRVQEFAYIEEYNRDLARHAQHIYARLDDARDVYLDEEAQAQLKPSEERLLGVMAQADILAALYQRHRAAGFMAAMVAALAFVVFVLVQPTPDFRVLLAVYAVLAGMVALFLRMTGRRRYARKYTRYRTLSQFLCVQLYMEVGNIRDYFFHIPWWQRTPELAFAERTAAALRKTQWGSTIKFNMDHIFRKWVTGDHFRYRYESGKKERDVRWMRRWARVALVIAVALFFVVDWVALATGGVAQLFAQGGLPGILLKCVLGAAAVLVVLLTRAGAALYTDPRQKTTARMYRTLAMARKRFSAIRQEFNRRILLNILLLLANAQVEEALEWYLFSAHTKKRRSQRRRSIPRKKFSRPRVRGFRR